MHAWTDSQVVLSWLTSSRSSFKVFVTNRLAKISNLIPSCHWNFIPSALNPADCVSRGLLPSQAISHSLYFQRPPFLQQSESNWSNVPCNIIPSYQLPDFKEKEAPVCIVMSLDVNEWFHRFSTFTRMQRVIAYVLRFIRCARRLPVHSRITPVCFTKRYSFRYIYGLWH